MKAVIEKIITNVLTSLYEPLGFALIISVLLMFFYMFSRESGVKVLLRKWINEFKKSSKFRLLFLLCFYTAMIAFKTLLNRNMWQNPLSDVIGPWGFYRKDGTFTTEVIENLMLFIPFSILLLCTFKDKLLKNKIKFLNISLKSSVIVFLLSLTIEFTQLIFRLGTFQLSDLFYNTLGGFIGGVIYFLGLKIIKKYTTGRGN